MKKKIGFDLLIPIIIASVFTLLNLFTFFKNGENSLYDLLLHIKPPVPEEETLLFLDIDDTAIANVGVFPWSRDIMAEGLILMKEFEAAYAVFDIEYTEQSPLGVNSDMLNEQIPEAFEYEFASINQNISDLFKALRTGTISLNDAEEYINDLTGLTDMSKASLLEKMKDIARDNDTYLGRAARLFGNTYFTVNMLSETEEIISDKLKTHVLENIALKNARADPEFPFTVPDIRPAILPILKGAKGAGFPNVIVDDDGVRRRIDLVMGYQGKFFPQLSFAALLDWLGNPEIDSNKNRILLKKATMPDGQEKDISIPLAEDRRILINWPNKKFIDSFRHLTYYELVYNKRLESSLIHNVKIMDEAGYLSYFQGDFELLAPYLYAESIKEEILSGGETALIDDYRQAREMFFQELGSFITGGIEESIISEIDSILTSDEISEELKASYKEIREEVPEVFGETREIFKNLAKSRSILKSSLKNSFCIIGWIGTSTTDIGVNPFEKEYMNVGTHASLVNTILTGLFLDDLPWWYSAVLAGLLALIVTLIIRNLNPLPLILVGAGILILLTAGGAAFFLFTGIYLNLLTPILTLFFTLVALTLFKFLILEKEKSFLRNAFSHYLSTDVINELISDPEKLNLGGEKKYLTAMFTDIRGFSTISESLDPTDLVKLLNAYLTEMSNIVLDQKGTIDKYEGDAIICFFGAPVSFQDHAARACMSAVRMKRMEKILNEHFIKEKLSDSPLFTRIGINTGEMVVGNMGTSQKMDYTIMGSSVNLASRLEGVNKQYGTWILMSEAVYKEAGKGFITRQMDRVRVVGISEPVRLYELIEEKSRTDSSTKEAIETFHHGQEYFEQKDWDRAMKAFHEVLKILPGDGPSEVFIKRCGNYRRKSPPESWDGVFNLTVK